MGKYQEIGRPTGAVVRVDKGGGAGWSEGVDLYEGFGYAYSCWDTVGDHDSLGKGVLWLGSAICLKAEKGHY